MVWPREPSPQRRGVFFLGLSPCSYTIWFSLYCLFVFWSNDCGWFVISSLAYHASLKRGLFPRRMRTTYKALVINSILIYSLDLNFLLLGHIRFPGIEKAQNSRKKDKLFKEDLGPSTSYFWESHCPTLFSSQSPTYRDRKKVEAWRRRGRKVTLTPTKGAKGPFSEAMVPIWKSTLLRILSYWSRRSTYFGEDSIGHASSTLQTRLLIGRPFLENGAF